jgi:uncharacterized membrane protein YgcG
LHASRHLPDLVLSGHSHLYERYSRTIAGNVIPYVVAGNGGFYNLAGTKTDKNGNPPTPGVTGTDGKGNPLTLKTYNETTFGFLRLTVSPDSIVFESLGVTSGPTSTIDSFTVDLNAHTVTDGILTGGSSGGGSSSGGSSGGSGSSTSQPKHKPKPPQRESDKKKRRR